MATNPKINGKFDIIGLVIKVCFHFFKNYNNEKYYKKYKMEYLENVSNCLMKKKKTLKNGQKSFTRKSTVHVFLITKSKTAVM